MSNNAFQNTPKTITAGDTVKWSASLSDYPASSGWVLHYTLVNANNTYQIDATASGNDSAVNVLPAASANYVAGTYQLAAWVDGVNSERHTLGVDSIEILPNLAATTTGFDGRSAAKKCLDQLDAALAQYGKKAYTQEYSIGDRRMRFTSPAEFMAFRKQVKAEVNKEKQIENMKLGKPAGSKILVRF